MPFSFASSPLSESLKQANLLPTDVARVRVSAAKSYVGSVSCWFSLLLREISPRVLRTYPLPQKPTFPNSNSTRNGTEERHKEPLCGCATSKSLFIYLFIYFYLMFLQATFKLEPYCVMLALRRQNQQRHHSHYLYILLVSNTAKECCALLRIEGKVLLYLSWFYFYPRWFELI